MAKGKAASTANADTKGSRWPLHQNWMPGRIVLCPNKDDKNAPPRRGIVLYPKTHNGHGLAAIYLVRWDDLGALDAAEEVAGSDIKLWMTDEFANQPFVLSKMLDLQQNNWHPLDRDFVRTRGPPVVPELPESLRPARGSAHDADAAGGSGTAAADAKKAASAAKRAATVAEKKQAAAAAAAGAASGSGKKAAPASSKKVAEAAEPQAAGPSSSPRAETKAPAPARTQRATAAEKGKAPAKAAPAAKAAADSDVELLSSSGDDKEEEEDDEGTSSASEEFDEAASEAAYLAAGGVKGHTILSPATNRQLPAHLCCAPGDLKVGAEEDEDGDFKVVCIMDQIQTAKGGGRSFLVKWKGYELDVGNKAGSKGHWEPASQLKGNDALKKWTTARPDWWTAQKAVEPPRETPERAGPSHKKARK